MTYTDMTVRQLADALEAGRLTSEEITKAYLENIKEKDGEVGAYITVTHDLAMKQAKSIDKRRENGEKLSPLAGIPAGIKDNMCTKGVLTTCASKILANFVPPYTATAVKKLEENGLVMLGKLNLDEFAMGSTTENSAFKATHNPRKLDRVPGGSSGGSAAAVAAKTAAYTLGSDTGGSIRQPAAFCGVVGMKPTYGSASRYGLVAFASSLDQLGPLTKDVYDNAMVLNAIAGYDKMDATSVNREYGGYTDEIDFGVKGMKIALPKEFYGAGLNDEIRKSIMSVAEQYANLGAEIIELSMKTIDHALPAYYVLSSAEASSNLARFDGVKYGYCTENYESIDDLYKNSRSEGFGPEVQRRIMLGSFALSSGYYDAYYKKALQVRTLAMRDFADVFKKADAILSPVAPTTAYKIGEKTSDPLEMYMGDVYTVPVNIAGLPSLSMPCGEDSEGLPIGMQLIGPAFSEKTLYRIGLAYEKVRKLSERGAY